MLAAMNTNPILLDEIVLEVCGATRTGKPRATIIRNPEGWSRIIGIPTAEQAETIRQALGECRFFVSKPYRNLRGTAWRIRYKAW